MEKCLMQNLNNVSLGLKNTSVGLFWLLRSSSKQLFNRSQSQGASSPLCPAEKSSSLKFPCFRE